jgi:hypothetical protein
VVNRTDSRPDAEAIGMLERTTQIGLGFDNRLGKRGRPWQKRRDGG